jgi:hypothetical protein
VPRSIIRDTLKSEDRRAVPFTSEVPLDVMTGWDRIPRARWLGLIGDPDVEGGLERVAVAEVVLEGQESEQRALGRVRSRLVRRIDMTIGYSVGPN